MSAAIFGIVLIVVAVVTAVGIVTTLIRRARESKDKE